MAHQLEAHVTGCKLAVIHRFARVAQLGGLLPTDASVGADTLCACVAEGEQQAQVEDTRGHATLTVLLPDVAVLIKRARRENLKVRVAPT